MKSWSLETLAAEAPLAGAAYAELCAAEGRASRGGAGGGSGDVSAGDGELLVFLLNKFHTCICPFLYRRSFATSVMI